MGLTGRLLWMSLYSKKQWRRLFWRVRASLKKAVKSSGGRVRLLRGGPKGGVRFQYDPSSYALNFDDGCKGIQKEEEEEVASAVDDDRTSSNGFHLVKLRHQISSISNSENATAATITWVYVLWVGRDPKASQKRGRDSFIYWMDLVSKKKSK